MNDEKYIMSFTAAGLFESESERLIRLYLSLMDWSKVREKALSENLFQARTTSSLKRVCREIIFRLQTLNLNELEFLTEASPRDQKYLLWIAVCRRYKFIAEFSVEVLRERFISLKQDLQYEEFDIFFNRKSEWHEELEKIKPATRAKLRQVLFRLLREADLLTTNNYINAAMPSHELLNLIFQENRQEILFFPIFESDLKVLSK